MAYDEDLAHRIRAGIGDLSDVTEKKMFGGLAFLIGGHMSVSASGQGGIMLRCSAADQPGLLARPHVERVVMRGREMSGWLRIDVASLDADAGDEVDLAELVAYGISYARGLPPKQ